MQEKYSVSVVYVFSTLAGFSKAYNIDAINIEGWKNKKGEPLALLFRNIR